MEWLTLSPPYFCPLINFVLQQQLKALQWLPVTLKRKSEILTKACQTIHDPQLDASLAISHIFLLLGHYIPSPSTGRRGYIVCREFFFNLFVFDNFLMWTIFSLYWIFYNVASVLCFVFFWLRGMWDLSSLTRDWTHATCVGRQSLNHWTTREVLVEILKRFKTLTYSICFL